MGLASQLTKIVNKVFDNTLIPGLDVCININITYAPASRNETTQETIPAIPMQFSKSELFRNPVLLEGNFVKFMIKKADLTSILSVNDKIVNPSEASVYYVQSIDNIYLHGSILMHSVIARKK